MIEFNSMSSIDKQRIMRAIAEVHNTSHSIHGHVQANHIHGDVSIDHIKMVLKMLQRDARMALSTIDNVLKNYADKKE